jgi:hypothetical protein
MTYSIDGTASLRFASLNALSLTASNFEFAAVGGSCARVRSFGRFVVAHAVEFENSPLDVFEGRVADRVE